MSDEQYVPTAADRKVSILHIAAGHLRATVSATADDVVAFAEKLHAWVGGDTAKTPRAPKKNTSTPAEGAKTTSDPKPETKTAVEPDLDTDADDDFLNEGTAETKTEEKPKPATMEQVRAALLALQTRTNATTARKVLTTAGGAETLGKLKLEKFQAVIDAANKQTTELAA